MKLKNDPIADMSTASKYLTTESFSITDSIDQGKDHLRTILAGIGSILENAKTSIDSIKQYKDSTSQERDFIKLLQVVPYTTWKEYQATVPAGFIGKYIDYLTIIKSEADVLGNFNKNTLVPYVRYLALLLSDADAGKSTNNTDALQLTMREKHREQANAAFGKLFNTGHIVNVKVSNVVDRSGDWATVFKLRKEIFDTLNAQKPRDVADLLKQAEDYLALIIEQLDADKLQLSPQAKARIGEQAYQIAREAEQLASIRYRMETLDVAINATNDRFKIILE